MYFIPAQTSPKIWHQGSSDKALLKRLDWTKPDTLLPGVRPVPLLTYALQTHLLLWLSFVAKLLTTFLQLP